MKYTDLKLIDELLCDMKGITKTWREVEMYSIATRAAMQRLREAWMKLEMKEINPSLEDYFKEERVEDP